MALHELQTAHLSDTHLAEILHPSVNGTDFRQALGRLAAGTSIITTCDEAGNKLGMTATAVTSVSLDPPLVLVCVDQQTRTAAALMEGAPFVVQFLAAHQESIAWQFASRVPDKFAGIDYDWTQRGCPRLMNTLASVECMPYATYPGGDHTIVVGRVVEVQVADNLMSPLIYFRSTFLKHVGVEQ